MSFSASVMNRVNVNIANMFASGDFSKTDQIAPAVTANALLGMNTARVADRLVDGKCVGVKVWYTDTTDVGEVAAPSDCTTPGGNQISTASVDYDTAVLANAAGTALDGRCNNEIDFVTESTQVIAKCISSIRTQFNEYVINALDAAAQTNLSSYLPERWTTDGAIIQVPKTDLKWDNLGYLRQIASLNNFTRPIWISGAQNFWGEWWKSNYMRFDANGPSVFQAFQDQRFYFDERQLDQVIGAPTTLCVDQLGYAFWNMSSSPATPTEKSFGSNGKKWVWSIPDTQLQYSNNGRLTPVRYEVEIEESCSGRDANSMLIMSYKYYVRLIGGFKMAPPGPNGETGTLQFNAISGI